MQPGRLYPDELPHVSFEVGAVLLVLIALMAIGALVGGFIQSIRHREIEPMLDAFVPVIVLGGLFFLSYWLIG